MKKIFGKFYCNIHRALTDPSGKLPADQAVEFNETNKAIEAIEAIDAIEKKNK